MAALRALPFDELDRRIQSDQEHLRTGLATARAALADMEAAAAQLRRQLLEVREGVDREPLPDFLSIKEVARRLSTSPDTVRRLVDRREIPSVLIAGLRRIPAPAYLAYCLALEAGH